MATNKSPFSMLFITLISKNFAKFNQELQDTQEKPKVEKPKRH